MSQCSPTHATFPTTINGTTISQLVGYSLGRLGLLYYLKAASAEDRAQINTIIMLDPGSPSDFGSCDTGIGAGQLLENWLSSSSGNRLVIIGGSLTVGNNWQAVTQDYLKGVSSSLITSQVYACAANSPYSSHGAVMSHYALSDIPHHSQSARVTLRGPTSPGLRRHRPRPRQLSPSAGQLPRLSEAR